LTSKSIQAASKPVHQSSSESSLKKGRIAFTALSSMVGKARSIAMLLRVVGEGELPVIFVVPAEDEQELR
jgi:hypothetical protein